MRKRIQNPESRIQNKKHSDSWLLTPGFLFSIHDSPFTIHFLDKEAL
jgi:hypothetical protein